MRRWLGNRDRCDLCGCDISKTKFVDGRVAGFAWALMCLACHRSKGAGLGTGLGQLYNEAGEKVEG